MILIKIRGPDSSVEFWGNLGTWKLQDIPFKMNDNLLYLILFTTKNETKRMIHPFVFCRKNCLRCVALIHLLSSSKCYQY